METTLLSVSEPNALDHAADVLRHGGVVAFPTDTVYGLGVLASDEEGIVRLYLIKGRNRDKAIAILISSIDAFIKVADTPSDTAMRLAEEFWPGPLTLVVPRHPDLPDMLSPSPFIGVRLPDHNVARNLLNLVGPMAVTSANLSSKPSAVTARQVVDQLNGRVHLTLDGGPSPGGVPSTVVDCSGEDIRILRPGPISESELRSVLE
jgi:L-threonylcarbamoyladenylate synthase